MTEVSRGSVGTFPAWRRAIEDLGPVRNGRWAVGGSAALALHGLRVHPRDVDLIADHEAASELIETLGEAIRSDEAPWDRGDVRAHRRALAVLYGVQVEILVDVEAVDPAGNTVMTSPNLDLAERVLNWRRHVPVLSLTAMLVVQEATGKFERARMVRDTLEQRRAGAPSSG